jgi:endonuclease/exonuclease/phosphatase family metal-dependent hydrolase
MLVSLEQRPEGIVRRIAGLIGVVLLCWMGSCDPFRTGFQPTESAVIYVAQEQTSAEGPGHHLKVMTWNVKFGGARIDFFFDCHGDRVLMTEDEVLKNMEGLVAQIVVAQPDVVLLQEVDVGSKRSAYVDMVQHLLDHTHLNHGAYASQWRGDFVPSDGVGRVDSGNAILSRWPLQDGTRIALPLVGEYDGLKKYFYLKRNILRVRAVVPERDDLFIMNVHTEAYAQDGTKKQHIDRFKDELDRLVAEGHVVIAGGDLNAIPPGSVQTGDYIDAVCVSEDFIADDYTEQIDWLASLYADYTPAIPLEAYQADNSAYFTHSTHIDTFWNRKLDYIFTNAAVVQGSGITHQDKTWGAMDTMRLSDHCPITVDVILP